MDCQSSRYGLHIEITIKMIMIVFRIDRGEGEKEYVESSRQLLGYLSLASGRIHSLANNPRIYISSITQFVESIIQQ